MLAGLITIAGGILAASGLIIARKPNAKDLIDKIAPYQGWIGVVMFGWGIWELFGSLTHMSLMKFSMLLWLFWFASGVADLLVGFLLGFGLITKYTMKSPAVKARGQQIRAKLVPYQGLCGLLAIATGTLYIVLPYVL
jgi:hypothetical protein